MPFSPCVEVVQPHLWEYAHIEQNFSKTLEKDHVDF